MDEFNKTYFGNIQCESTYDNEQTTDLTRCITCGLSDRAVAFMPCSHFVNCIPCGHDTTECPVCHSRIMAYVKIYQ